MDARDSFDAYRQNLIRLSTRNCNICLVILVVWERFNLIVQNVCGELLSNLFSFVVGKDLNLNPFAS